MEQVIENGQIVQTVRIDLQLFIGQRQQELDMNAMQMQSLVDRQAVIIAELESLIVS